jgi:hypothetical protein
MVLTAIALIVSALFAGSIVSFLMHRTIWRALQLFGAVGLTIVVFTHVAESRQVLSGMGWGQPNSVGHYLDLASAILGCSLLPLGMFASAVAGRKKID